MVRRVFSYHHLWSIKPHRYIVFGYEPHKGNDKAIAKTAHGFTFLSPALSKDYAIRWTTDGYKVDLDNLEKKFPHDMKDIEPKLQDSGFLDDDSFENKERDINNLFNKEELNDYIENKDNEEFVKENNDKNISNNSNNENDLIL